MTLPLPPETRALLSALPMACLLLDGDGQVAFANAVAEDTLQRSNRALCGQALGALFPSAANNLAPLLQAAQDQRDQHVTVRAPEIEIDSLHGASVLVSAHISSFHIPSLDETAWLLLLVPLSFGNPGARTNALKERAGSLAAMTGMLAHEIKNPLAAIRGAAQLMAEASAKAHDHVKTNAEAELHAKADIKVHTDAEVNSNTELAQLIISETDRISKLLDTMELFSSPEDLEAVSVNIHESLGAVVRAARLSFGTHITFIEDFDPSLPDVWANPHVLHRVFMNLLKNACEACGDRGGQVRLRTRYHVSERRRLWGGERRADLPIRVSFIDNGAGIAEDMKDKLFDAFISTKDQGRGLGLSYVAGAVASMEGDIDVVSRAGLTEFQLRLPQASVRTAK